MGLRMMILAFRALRALRCPPGHGRRADQAVALESGQHPVCLKSPKGTLRAQPAVAASGEAVKDEQCPLSHFSLAFQRYRIDNLAFVGP